MAIEIAAMILIVMTSIALRLKSQWNRKVVKYFEGGEVPHNDMECVGDVQDAISAVIADKGHPIIEASSDTCKHTITLTWMKQNEE